MLQDRKHFGMSTTQLAILAGLGLAACCLFGVAGFMVLQGGPGRASAPPVPQETRTPQSTATPFVLPSITPTLTLTPRPYEQLIPDGWVQFKTGLIEIWLPKEFKVEKKNIAEYSVNLAVPEMVAVRPASRKTTPYKIFVVVSFQPMPVSSLNDYITTDIFGLAANVRVADRRMVNINSRDAARFVFESRTNALEFNELAYVFQDGSTVWYIEYVAEISEYFEVLESVFEKSAKTFRIVR